MMKSEALPIVHRSLVSALDGAEQELRSGRIVCSRDTITSAIARVKEFSQIIQPRIGMIDEAGEVANAITHACYVCKSFGLMARMLGTKTAVMQVLYNDHVVKSSATAHTAMDEVRKHITQIPKMASVSAGSTNENLRQLNALVGALELDDLSTQLEPLAFINKMEADGKSLPPATKQIKRRLLACTVDYVKRLTSTIPDWFRTDCDYMLISTSMKVACDKKTQVAVELRTDFVSRGWDNAFDKITPMEQFAKTIDMWYNLKHGNLCALVGANPFAVPDALVATEHCAFGTLADYLLTIAPSNRVETATRMLTQAAQAVCYLHSVDFVHGDLRCGNVRVTVNQTAKVAGPTDYLAWYEIRTGKQAPDKKTNPAAIDTTRWLPPELVAGQSVPTPETDVYAFGLTIFEALTGKIPYAELDDRSVRSKKPMLQQPLGLSGLLGIESCLRVIIRGACQPNPADRPTMQDIVQSLLRVVTENAQTASQQAAVSPTTVSRSVQPQATTIPPRLTPSVSPAVSSPADKQAQRVVVTRPEQRVATAQAQELRPVETPPTTKPHQPATDVAARIPLPASAPVSSKVAPIGGTPPAISPIVRPAPAREVIIVRSSTPLWVKVAIGVLLLILFIVCIVLATKKSDDTSSPTPAATWNPSPTYSTPTPTWTPSPTTVTPAPTQTTVAPSPTLTVSTVVSITAPTSALTGIAVDRWNYIYVSDMYRIYEIKPSSTSATVYAGQSTKFNGISGIAVDYTGDIYVADSENKLVRKIVYTSSTVSTLAGGGYYTTTAYPMSPTSADIGKPIALAIDSSNNVYGVDWLYDRIFKFESATSQLTIFTASVYYPRAITVTSFGNMYVCSSSTVYRISSDGQTKTWLKDGFTFATGLALSLTEQDLYIVDQGAHCIRKLRLETNVLSTIAGLCGYSGSADGSALSSARFDTPSDITVAKSGAIYVVDGSFSARVRKLVS